MLTVTNNNTTCFKDLHTVFGSGFIINSPPEDVQASIMLNHRSMLVILILIFSALLFLVPVYTLPFGLDR